MFIETLEFTIPVDLCDLFSSLKRGPRSNMEFPASVNSYGTTQDANIQVLLKANKLTFKVDGVSSNSSMISKSECKTLKLSVFDVDCTIGEQEEAMNMYGDSRIQNAHQSSMSKRPRDYSVPEPSPPAKSSRTSFSDSQQSRNIPHHHSSSRVSNQSQSKSQNDIVNVKQEPEDPDLIEIEPDDIVPKKETPYMQIDYSSDVPHTQTSQAALERLSHHQSSHSQSPASSSSSFHQNVPHVPDYSEPGPSQGHHGDQSADDFLVFQDDNEDGDDNEADYSNDENLQSGSVNLDVHQVVFQRPALSVESSNHVASRLKCYICSRKFKSQTELDSHMFQHTDEDHPRCQFADCGISFDSDKLLLEHITNLHCDEKPSLCPGCGSRFHFKDSLNLHASSCLNYLKAMVPEKKKNAQCEECGKYFASRQLKEEHVNSQHRGVIFACSCGQTYAYRTGLARHRKATGHMPAQLKTLSVIES